MIEQEITLLTNGRISFQKCGNGLQFGYSKNRGVYSIKVKTSGEWNGLTIRAFWHVPDGKDPASSLVVDGYVDSGLFSEDDIAEVETLAQAYYDALDAKDAADAEKQQTQR